MNVFKNIVKPIIGYPIYFVFFFVLIGIPEIYVGIRDEYIGLGRFNWAIINLTATIFMISYMSSLILYLLPSKVKALYIYITLVIVVLHFIGSIFLLKTYGDVLNADIMSIILNSNKEEMGEYLSMYLPETYFIILIMVFAGILASYYLMNKYIGRIKCNNILIGIFLITSLGLTIRRPIYFGDLFPYKYIKFIIQNKVPNLSEYTKEIQINSFKSLRPQNIILIIGESFSRHHSSLYGYNKKTNPLLAKLRNDSLLYVYSDVISPATHTIACFQNIMSTYNSDNKDSIPWYKCTTLIDVFRKAKYKTYWVSNQSKHGLYDNIPSKYADLCDKSFWIGNKFASLNRTTFDEDLIPLIKPLLNNKDENRLIICHLMGSHQQFQMRYPHKFERFKKQEYEDYPEFQRDLRATYDNSILYNDSVIYEMMNSFMNEEAIVFYFSDHAIDVFQSKEEYIGHVRPGDTESIEYGVSIPFMIFTSPLFKEKFPVEMKMIKDCTLQPFNTGNMIYTLMDLVGISFEGEDLEGKSLFRYK